MAAHTSTTHAPPLVSSGIDDLCPLTLTLHMSHPLPLFFSNLLSWFMNFFCVSWKTQTFSQASPSGTLTRNLYFR